MSVYFPWEDQLLSLAMRAWEDEPAEEASFSSQASLLEEAYRRCDQITRANSKTFYTASSLLPAEKQRAVRALYAFCRISDDLIDCGGDEALHSLRRWQAQILHPRQSLSADDAGGDPLVALAWNDARHRFRIPALYTRQLLDGIADDLHKKRYQDFDQLAGYCYRVASTVGLMSAHIIGFSGADAVPYAIRLGVALQLTNILRDVGADWRIGRLYLPREELQAFNLGEADIQRSLVTREWREFMRFQIQRARLLYQSAMPGVRLLHRSGRFAIGAAAELYQAILSEIEKNDYDVFTRRAFVSRNDKLRHLPGIWWRSWRGSYPAFRPPAADFAWRGRSPQLNIYSEMVER